MSPFSEDFINRATANLMLKKETAAKLVLKKL